MSIVSSVVKRAGDHITERHTDHLGQEYMQTWFVPNGWTQAQIDARVENNKAQLLVALADSEFERVIG